MKLTPGNFCPLLQKECIGLECAWIVQVRGMNPNTGEEVDEWKCAVAWMPMLQIETSQQSRQTGAAVESFRNEVVKANEINQQLYIESMNQGIIPPVIQQILPPEK
jgi:hypothetical protein